MRKYLTAIIFLFVSLFVFGFVKVSADPAPGTITITNGASVRTANPVGLKFEAIVTGDWEGAGTSVKYGFVISRGSFSKSLLLSNLAKSKAVKVDCGTPDGEGKFFLTVIDIPETGYAGNITALAYVNVDGEDYYSDIAVTRNIAQVAAVANNNGIEADIIDDVVTYTASHYMIESTLFTGEYVLSPVDENVYNYAHLADMWADFIADFNSATGSSLTSSSTLTQFHTALATGIASNSVRTFPESCNAVKFFSGATLVKWGWILDYFKNNGSTVHIKNQANGLLRSDRTCQSYDGHRLRHLGGSIYNLFHKTHEMIDGMAANDFTGGESSYTGVWTTFNSSKASQLNNIVEIGEDVTLPSALVKAGYDFAGYRNSSLYLAEASYEVTSSLAVFKPEFSPTSYTITYHLDGGSNGVGNPSSYTIETATINLADATKAGYVFAGWYGNGSFTGDAITSIPKGSTGDIDLYAKYIREVSIVNPAWVGTGNGTKVSYSDTEYTFGTDAFATIASAVAAASPYEQIYVLAGTYSETFTISTAGVNLIGPNDGVLGNSGSRVTEAEITGGTITLGKNLAGCTITGFKFSGTSNIVNTTGDAGTAANPATNLNGFTFSYNKVNTSLTSGKGFIYFTEASSSYSHNLVFRGNSFTQTVTGISAMIYLDNNAGLSIIDNSFSNITGDAVYVNDTTKGLAGDLTATGNSFVSITKGAIFNHWYSPLPDTSPDILVRDNYFKDVDGGACVNFEKCNGGDNYNSFVIELNVFDDVFKVYWVYTSTQTGSSYGSIFRNNVVFKYEGGLSDCYTAKGGAIDCASNLYLSADGATVYTTTVLSNFSFGAYAEHVNTSNYASIKDYNDATGKGFSLPS